MAIKKSLINPYLYRQFSNNPTEMFNYTMTNLMDNYYGSVLDQTTDGSIKAVCLSGLRTEDNTGGGTDPTDAYNDGKHLWVTVRLLDPAGTILPDPALASTPEEARSFVRMHSSAFLARSDFELKDTDPPQFGQILNCYLDGGSLKNSDFSGLRFSKPTGVEFDERYGKVAMLVGVSNMQDFFKNTTSSLMGMFGSQEELPNERGTLFEDNVVKKFANELPSAANKNGGVGIDPNNLNLFVQSQIDFWKGKKESTAEPQYSMLTAYWNHVGWTKKEWTPSSVPWSAAFISFQLASYNFKPAASHYKYTEQIMQGLSPGWKAFSLIKGPVRINAGDVVIKPRGKGAPKDKPYWATHGDLVYKIEGGKAFLAGGNVSNTAKNVGSLDVDSNGLCENFKKYIVILKKVS